MTYVFVLETSLQQTPQHTPVSQSGALCLMSPSSGHCVQVQGLNSHSLGLAAIWAADYMQILYYYEIAPLLCSFASGPSSQCHIQCGNQDQTLNHFASLMIIMLSILPKLFYLREKYLPVLVSDETC